LNLIKFTTDDSLLREITLAGNNCEDIIFYITPIEKGADKLMFNIHNDIYNKVFVRDVEIK
jgi:hypothetical protein